MLSCIGLCSPGFPSVLSAYAFTTEIMCMFLLYKVHVTCLVHLIYLEL